MMCSVTLKDWNQSGGEKTHILISHNSLTRVHLQSSPRRKMYDDKKQTQGI